MTSPSEPDGFFQNATDNSNKGLIDGNQATFYYQITPSSITLENASTKDLVVNNINCVDLDDGVQVTGGQVNNSIISLGNDQSGLPIPDDFKSGQAVTYSVAPGETHRRPDARNDLLRDRRRHQPVPTVRDPRQRQHCQRS